MPTIINPPRQAGLSLVELMVGVAVGFFVVLAAGTVYLNTFASSAVSTRLVKLNQDMRSIMDVMIFDIHRAGAWGGARPGVGGNPFTRRAGDGLSGTPADIYVSSDRRCILYTYDLNLLDPDPSNPGPEANEFFGFRYNDTAQQIEVLDPDGVLPTDTSAITDCSAYSWNPVNVPSEVVVTGLAFSTEGSQCLAFNPTTFTVNNANSFVRWQLTGANSLAACDTTGGSGGTTVPAATSYTPSPVTIPGTHTSRSEVRQVVVTLTASHARDATLTRTLTETIRVRNDRVL